MKTQQDYKEEIDRIIGYYSRAGKYPEVKESYNQYINLILLDSELSHYEKSELLLHWRNRTEE